MTKTAGAVLARLKVTTWNIKSQYLLSVFCFVCLSHQKKADILKSHPDHKELEFVLEFNVFIFSFNSKKAAFYTTSCINEKKL